MKKFRKIAIIVSCLLFCFMNLKTTTAYAESSLGYLDLEVNDDQIVILYTNDIHGGISDNEQYSGSKTSLGFAGLSAIKEEAMRDSAGVVLVDMGDALQGSVVCSESDGLDTLAIMNKVGYDYQILGNHEFDFKIKGVEQFIKEANATYLGVNYIDLKTNENLLKPYDFKEFEIDGKKIKIGFIGILTPENISKGTLSNYQDEEGNFLYSFNGEDLNLFYEKIQAAIDELNKENVDYIIALGHLGDEGITEGWSSIDVIENTVGLNVFLDGHAHSVIDKEIYKDKAGNEVILSSTGTKLNNVGALLLTVDDKGEVSGDSFLINKLTEAEKALESYKETAKFVEEIQQKYAHLMVKVGESDFGLYIYDPVTEERLIRSQETNLGDFITDAFRDGLESDVAFSNGGNIRADLPSGEITFLDIQNVLPWSDNIVKIKVTGQQLLDCLEMGARLWPEQSGGFVQTSGLTYKINTDVLSSVAVDSDGLFVRVEGDYRVQEVMVNDEPLDLIKEYTLAIDDYYYSEAGDGMTMFKDCEAIVDAKDKVVDHDLVISYLDKLGGKIPEEYKEYEGQGRIKFLMADDESVVEENVADNITKTSQDDGLKIIVGIGLIALIIFGALKLKNK
ncbi:MAG: bifunctional metallophosphatase/5'-nucleotidase [Erysipelotrichaceae bacterium]|nr:bifunctional metallophosphatase/5'-nucleotidase [Erysipelotrichaceae bacterium]MDY5251431.1 bifunctional UDP-sugar hydrolase/5'-nucleotidase [Erysipelotrichaceae bacterium]